MWKMNGCSENCMKNVHQLSIVDIITYHNLFALLPRNSWILDYFKMNSSSDLETTYSIIVTFYLRSAYL